MDNGYKTLINLLSENAVQYIAIDSYTAQQLNRQSCDCDSCVIVFSKTNILVSSKKKDDFGIIILEEIPEFNMERFNLLVKPKGKEEIKYIKTVCNSDGTIDAIKFQYGESYLFVFADEYNLIVTKSVSDLTEDDWNFPDVDPSILF